MKTATGVVDYQGREIYVDEDVDELFVYIDGERHYDPELEKDIEEAEKR